MAQKDTKTPQIEFDVMLHGYFVCTLRMPLGLKHLKGYKGDKPLFEISERDLQDFVEQKRPSLAGKDYRIEFCTRKPVWRN